MGRADPNLGPTCLEVYEVGENNMPDMPPGSVDDELLGTGGTDAGGNFTIMLVRPLVPGDQIFVVDVCADPIVVGPAMPVFVPAPAPALSGFFLVVALLVLSGLALSSIRRRRSSL
jgi:hypothetical protein